MAQKGLDVPVSVNKGGGASKSKEETQLDKLIILAVQEGGDDNPFQDLGLKPRIIYRINDETSKFDIAEDIMRVLESFKGRIKVSPDGIVVNQAENTTQTEEGVMNVSFEYINLETEEVNVFEDLVKNLGG